MNYVEAVDSYHNYKTKRDEQTIKLLEACHNDGITITESDARDMLSLIDRYEFAPLERANNIIKEAHESKEHKPVSPFEYRFTEEQYESLSCVWRMLADLSNTAYDKYGTLNGVKFKFSDRVIEDSDIYGMQRTIDDMLSGEKIDIIFNN